MPKLTDKPKRTTKAFRISVTALDMLDYCAKATKQSRQAFIEQLISEIFNLVSVFNNAKLVFSISVLDSTLEIEAIGDSMLKIGEFKIKSLKEKKVSKK